MPLRPEPFILEPDDILSPLMVPVVPLVLVPVPTVPDWSFTVPVPAPVPDVPGEDEVVVPGVVVEPEVVVPAPDVV